jgi:hypothetical protein
MGQTDKTQAEFHAFLESISPRFTAFTYNLLENNCNNFSDTVCLWKQPQLWFKKKGLT